MTTTTFDPATLLSEPTAGCSCHEVAAFVKGKRFHVTGGGGTIGRAVCEALVEYGAAAVVAIDRDELRLSEVPKSPGVCFGVLADVSQSYPATDCKPDCVIHCAAYKHVDTLQGQPLQANENNVIATGVVALWCRNNRVPMVYLSTDKAISPVGVLGLTKALGEHVAREIAGARVVRLVNVIGSSGSVVEKWAAQIEKGQPLSVCNPSHLRHYITARNAANTVLSALLGPRLATFIPAEYETISTGELVDRMLEAFDKPAGGWEATCDRPGERAVEPLLEPGHVHHGRFGCAVVTGFPAEVYSPQEVG
jgi:UDP-N-acetyl-D-glucosamine 4,6-dehydratase